MRKRLAQTASLRPLSGTVLARERRTILAYDVSLAWSGLLLIAFGLVMVYSASIAMAEASGRGKIDEAASRRELTKLLAHHDRIDARWLDYEMDAARLLDFPMMTDMRQPLTVAFHKARSHADLLRPATVDDAIGDRGTQLDYRDAVHDYATAFDVAAADAIRRRRSDFSAEGQQRLERAASAACGVRRRSDPTRTPERLRQGAPRARWADGVARHHARRNRAPDRRGDRGLTAAGRPESRRVDQRYR